MSPGEYVNKKRTAANITLCEAAELLEVHHDSLDDFERDVAPKIITLWLSFDRLSRHIPNMCCEEWHALEK